ncbi:Phospholipase_D-nuclease N-terminal [Geoalkalibacter ferrihydriticus]|uniref:Phospholipase_D-nuclease N-terminal n=1 Tax=Geoalkalibacter ferrihydriticus TaxID=392333 RepID=A0A1G9TJ28_9BACT|nr:PLDc N-terminal domain-containing protein [Geoalkalibacter ferrihydriticus]SDM47779.1 Phospholipase_D-nuclease N-terminal [Geoalkalibacter ferrihydriticus]
METILGIIILIADIWAIIQTIQSSATTGMKVLWVLIILLLPLIGLILWFFLGPKAQKV